MADNKILSRVSVTGLESSDNVSLATITMLTENL